MKIFLRKEKSLSDKKSHRLLAYYSITTKISFGRHSENLHFAYFHLIVVNMK